MACPGWFRPGGGGGGGGGGGNTVMIDSTLKDTIIIGNSAHGTEFIMSSIGIDTINNGGGVVIFRDAQNGFSAYPHITTVNSEIYEINNEEGAVTSDLDILTCFSDSESNQYIVNMFDKYSEVEKSKKMSYQSYIALLRGFLKKRGRALRFNELENYTIEEMDDLNSRLAMPDAERSRNERFLNSIRPDIRDLESYFYTFANNSIGEIFSGSKTIEKIFNSKSIVEVSLDFSTKPRESIIIMTAIVDNLMKLNYSAARKTGLAVLVDEIPNEYIIESGLNKLIKSKSNCNVVYSIKDISNLCEKSNEWIEYAESYFFFRQNSNKNKEFCSEFFGTYERRKVSETDGVSRPTLLSAIFMGGGASRNRSQTVTLVDERVYKADVFATLPDNECIFFYKGTNEHIRLTV